MFSYVEGPYPYAEVLLYAFFFGVLAGLWYECFRIVRSALKSVFHVQKPPWRYLYIFFVFLQDILYFLILTVAAVLFLYVCNRGQLRISILLCMTFGFGCYMKTVGKLIFRLHTVLLRLIVKTLRSVYRYTLRYILLFLRYLYKRSVGKLIVYLKKHIQSMLKKYARLLAMRQLEKLIKESSTELKEGKDYVSLH